MNTLDKKIDFMVYVTATKANANGDPLNGNMPRQSDDGYGEMSDVCIKRKIRNRFQDMGERVFVQSDDRADDGISSLKERADSCAELKAEFDKKKNANRTLSAIIACKEWIDVRTFGQVFAFKGTEVSLGIRGPVSIHQAVSVSPIDINSIQITKSVNSEAGKDSKASDTMGMKHNVEFGLYVVKGSVNCQLAEKTGYTYEDSQILKQALMTLFDNDASSARPEGSMEVCKLYWWEHDSKTPAVSTAKVHRSVKAVLNEGVRNPKSVADYTFSVDTSIGVSPEIIDLV